jgi:hypothetical protein
MDDYRIGGASSGGGQVQGQSQGQSGQLQGEDFPALPRTQAGSLGGLGDSGLGGLGQRQGMTSSRMMPQLDGMMGQQQTATPSGDAEKKVGSSVVRRGSVERPGLEYRDLTD